MPTPDDREDAARDALADFINRMDAPELERFKPAPKPTLLRANKGQAIFAWIAGIIALLIALTQLGEYDGAPALPSIVGVLLILWALSYKKPTA